MKSQQSYKHTLRYSTIFVSLFLFLQIGSAAPIIIDHRTTDISEIPSEWIDSVKANINWYYLHRSHGGQLHEGLDQIATEHSEMQFVDESMYYSGGQWRGVNIPTEANALRTVYYADGFVHHFWSTPSGTGEEERVNEHIFTINPIINVAMFVWCYDMNNYPQDSVQLYLDSMAAFEKRFPDIIWVYTTGNAQGGGENGVRRYQNNEMIRDWVRENPDENRVLYDFADLDAWHFNETTSQWSQGTFEYGGQTYPTEHPEFQEEVIAHTTAESCLQKGKATWYLMARIAGWNPNGIIVVNKNVLFRNSSVSNSTHPVLRINLTKDFKQSFLQNQPVFNLSGQKYPVFTDLRLLSSHQRLYPIIGLTK